MHWKFGCNLGKEFKRDGGYFTKIARRCWAALPAGAGLYLLKNKYTKQLIIAWSPPHRPIQRHLIKFRKPSLYESHHLTSVSNLHYAHYALMEMDNLCSISTENKFIQNHLHHN
jgi:hypothetical protein